VPLQRRLHRRPRAEQRQLLDERRLRALLERSHRSVHEQCGLLRRHLRDRAGSADLVRPLLPLRLLQRRPAEAVFQNDDCAVGETCAAGNSTTGTQDQPNGCSDLVCGRVNSGECCNTQQDGAACPDASSTGLSGKCSLKPYVACSTDPSSDLFGACSQQSGGDCLASARPCFDEKITRTGVPSPLGSYCIDDPSKGACTSNADCAHRLMRTRHVGA